MSQSKDSRRLIATSSSCDSNPSPGTSIQTSTSRLSKPTRPPPQSRLTYEQRAKSKIVVQTIEESSHLKSTSKFISSSQTPHKNNSSQNVNDLPSTEIPTSTSVPQASAYGSIPRPYPVSAGLTSRSGNSSSPSSSQKRVRPTWIRSQSGGVWYKQYRQISSNDDSSILSFRTASPFSDHGERDTTGVILLKPPARLEQPQIESIHQVTVDKPFETSDKAANGSVEQRAQTSQSTRRDRSFDVRQVLSAPIPMIRSWSRKVSARKISVPSKKSNNLPPLAEVRGHKSLLKRERTAAILEKVTAILENTSNPLKNRMRTWTHRSQSSSTSSEKMGSKRCARRQLGTNSHFRKRNSPENIISTTSSILRMQMGSTPGNSPADLATYKIKRTRSAETEEFFKIDISIRGQTSYLPSEARRIHTPPLPDEHATGPSRGFFFDYQIPESIETRKNLPQFSGANCFSQEFTSDDRILRHKTTASNVAPFALCAPRSKIMSSIQRPNAADKSQMGDWYDACLAQIDVGESTIDSAGSQECSSEEHNCKHEEQMNLAEVKRRRYEAQLDYSIPEHLPSSPLCPRNPKYWRIVKNKGSQFRGCWMHGYGEYDIVPGL